MTEQRGCDLVAVKRRTHPGLFVLVLLCPCVFSDGDPFLGIAKRGDSLERLLRLTSQSEPRILLWLASEEKDGGRLLGSFASAVFSNAKVVYLS